MSEAEDKRTFLGPHEGRELELMLDGKKHLCKFLIEDDQESHFSEKEFDQRIKEGIFVKDERVEQHALPDGSEIEVRNVLYATAAEAWRIQAMRLIEDIYQPQAGWRPDLERVIGSLLGYDPRDVELFIERLAARRG